MSIVIGLTATAVKKLIAAQTANNLPKPATPGTNGQYLQVSTDGTVHWATPLAITDKGDGTASIA